MQPSMSLKALLAIAATGLLTLSAPAHAGGFGEAGELEHARANARAGGPLSERDVELLERWGCLSGTEHPLCYRLSNREWQPYKHRKHRRYIER